MTIDRFAQLVCITKVQISYASRRHPGLVLTGGMTQLELTEIVQLAALQLTSTLSDEVVKSLDFIIKTS